VLAGFYKRDSVKDVIWFELEIEDDPEVLLVKLEDDVSGVLEERDIMLDGPSLSRTLKIE
jgi:hypothetical protein